jgi:hypothetical protein
MDIKPQSKIKNTAHEPIKRSSKKPDINDNLLGIKLSSSHKTRNSILSIAGVVILIFLILVVSHSSKQNSGISAATNSSSVQNDSNSSVPDDSANTSSQSLAQSEADLKAAQDKAAAAQAAADQAMANLNNISTTPPTYVAPTPIKIPVSAPSQGPTAWASGSGILSGTYYYKISYVDSSGVETDLGPRSLPVSPSNQEIWVSSIPTSSNKDVNQINLYRTLANSGMVGPYYLVNTFYGNNSTSYYDNKLDSSISYQAPKY